MKRFFWLFLLLISVHTSRGQATVTISDQDKKFQLTDFAIIKDQGFTFDKILSDSTFQAGVRTDSVRPGERFWLKINVRNPYATNRLYDIGISPCLQNTLYHFDVDNQKWVESYADVLNHDGVRRIGSHMVQFAGKSTTPIYVKIDLSAIKSGETARPIVRFTPEKIIVKRDQNILTGWICAMLVLFVFLLNNLYIYFSFKDKAVLYFFMAEVGGMIYVTTYRWLFQVWFPRPVFAYSLHTISAYYDINKILMHLSIVMVYVGVIQFTRTFLNTPTALPLNDKILRRSIIVYVVLSVIGIVVNLSGYNLEYYTLPFDNIFCLFLTGVVLHTGVLGYLRKLPSAATFLLANTLPLLVIFCIPIIHLFLQVTNEENPWLPELAVISQALGFSIALVARTRAIQDSLSASELNNRQLEFDLREVGYLNQLNALQIAKMNTDIQSEKTRNELLQERLETNQRELASSTLHMVQKNELLNHLKSQIQILSRPNQSTSRGLKDISTLIESNTQLDADWNKFKMHFEQVHPDFFENLKIKHPYLTVKEVRLYAYFHMKLSHKEIAALLNIDPASVRRAKTRLFKKLAIPETE